MVPAFLRHVESGVRRAADAAGLGTAWRRGRQAMPPSVSQPRDRRHRLSRNAKAFGLFVAALITL